MKKETFKDIVGRAKKGDQEAMSEIYTAYYDRISAYAYKRVLNIDITQDVVANTFFKIVKQIRKFKWKSDAQFNGWVYRIATNEIHTYYRKQAKYHLVAPEDVEKYFSDVSSEEQEKVEQGLDNYADFLKLHVAIKKLKPFYQAIIHMRYFEDLSYQEIAVATKKRAGTVRVSMHRALQNLKLVLGDDLNFLEKVYVKNNDG
jgi:RNA polymerase sigma-70 factor (ECF subfamily)